jgi:predicted permease
MITPPRLWRRLKALLAAPALDQDLDEEIRFHLEMETQRRIASGEDPVRAREAARRVFGGVSRHYEDTRDARGTRPVEEFLRDLRIAGRMLATRRTFAIVSILTLAIGIGATTSLGAAVYHVLLRPYPFAEADRIVAVWQNDSRTPERGGEFAPGNFVDLATRARAFDLIAAAEPWSVDWIGPEGPERFDAALVTQDAFPIQGLRPLLGRTFRPDEFVAGSDNVVVFSEQLWRNRFGADSSLIGRSLVLDSVPRLVIGVASPEALRPYAADVFLPRVARGDEATQRRNGYWTVFGRLAPGVSVERANVELRALSAQIASEQPATNRHTEFSVVGLREAMTGNTRRSLLVLLAAVALVLLIACVNVATLQIGEAVRRRRELAIRTAIGAGRGRLVRQLLTESLLLAALGSVAGLAVAFAGVRVIRAFAPSDLWMLRTLTFDAPLVGFAASLALGCTFVIALMPVMSARRIRLSESLAAGGRSGVGLDRRRAGRALVVSEVALALVLLVGAGLLIRSLVSLMNVDRGYRTANVLATNVQAWSYYPTAAHRTEFVRQAIARLEAVPAIERAGMTSALPLSWPIGLERTRVTVEGRPVAPGDEAP